MTKVSEVKVEVVSLLQSGPRGHRLSSMRQAYSKCDPKHFSELPSKSFIHPHRQICLHGDGNSFHITGLEMSSLTLCACVSNEVKKDQRPLSPRLYPNLCGVCVCVRARVGVCVCVCARMHEYSALTHESGLQSMVFKFRRSLLGGKAYS